LKENLNNQIGVISEESATPMGAMLISGIEDTCGTNISFFFPSNVNSPA